MSKARTRTLLEEADGGIVRRTVLPGGLRVITEAVPGVRSAAFGVWVPVGSRDETPASMGSAHYLEHLLFKGTTKRSALEISASIDAVGGDLNAFTTKEYTCFHARVLDVDLPLAIDVVCDVVVDALIRPEDVEAERAVILEEIAMVDDDPGELVHDAFAEALFGDTDLGRPILGTAETIEGISRGAINRFYRSRYEPSRMVIAAAGSLDHDAVVRAVKRAFGDRLGGDEEPASPRRGRPGARRPSTPVHVLSRETEQAHVVLGTHGIPRGDDRRYALGVLTTALGGGMSSRLFQEIREKRGLAYSTFAYSQGFADAGLLGIYVGCQPAKVGTALEVCRAEVASIVQHGLTGEEIVRAKGQLRGSTVLGQEDTQARMSRIAKSELHGEPLRSISDLLGRVDAVSAGEVHEVARDLLAGDEVLAIIGPFDGAEPALAGA